MVGWDWAISAVILLWLGLTIAAKMTHQTIPELIAGLKEVLVGGAEDTVDHATEVYA